ncbi:Bax inhibitor-1/YccA family protein [Nocardioides sp. AX2bis]|uniref:Bax inhibitor-1/YccA family protein n=1 Tax=Nocardioides sp. AX2bis TaxID=2653157 RepID=UPI0012F2233C|nr:Bax inhibitor-1/YccA family protein [Nocardioides sp. AX2bis]VXC06339.1 Uncharacterized membrane protein, YccA/Bax inhibitor family [Nocardioides sp. AX2bis]
MQSNNPVFRRSEEFNRGGQNAPSYGNQTYAGNGSAYPGYANDPSQWGTGQPGDQGYGLAADGGRMTIDSVVQKTAMTLGVVVLAALATWVLTPDMDASGNAAAVFSAAMIGSLGAFALSMVNSFKRVISPALVLAFAVLEGVALGAFSKVLDSYVATSTGESSIVSSAVLGTMAAFAGTLAAYKFFDIKVGDKFRKGVMAAMFGMVGLAGMSLVLSLFGVNTGLFGFGVLGVITAVVGLVLGVFMLIMDFDFVEKGIANGLPERESWRAAFAMTVSLVWIYTNLLRLLAIFSSD